MRHHWIAALVAAGFAVVLSACSDGGGGATMPLVKPAAVHCDAAANAGWCWQNTSVTGNRLMAVTFVDADHGWAVGDAGTLLVTIDGGKHWRKVSSGSSASLQDVAFHDPRNGWALAGDGSVLRTSDGGEHWQSTSMAVPAGSSGALKVLGPQTVLVVSDLQASGAISRDGGATFQPVPAQVNAISAGTGDCWTWNSNGLARLAGCDAASATAVSLPPGSGSPMSVSSDDGVHVLATTSPGTPGQVLGFASDDGGGHWSSIDLPQGAANVRHFNGRTGWLTGAGHWWRTVDGGGSWTPVVTPGAVTDPSDAPATNDGTIDANTIWILFGNHVVASRDGGASWIDGRVPGEADFRGQVLAVPSPTTLVVQFEDRIYATHDAGATWTPLLGSQGGYTFGEPESLYFWDRSNGIELLQDGSLLRTGDGGLNWTPEPGAASGSVSFSAGDLRVVSASKAWMIFDFGLLASDDAGRHWTPVSFSADPQEVPQALDFVDAMHGWIVALGGDVFRTDDGGAHWAKIGATAVPLYLGSPREMRFRDTTTGLLVMSTGSIERSTDGGATWQETGLYDTGPMSAHVRWSDTHTAWMVDNNVFRSTDDGKTWVSQTDKLPGAFVDAAGLRDVYFSDPAHGWLVGREQVYATTDGGSTWMREDTSIGALLGAVFFVDARTGWIGEANGRILATGTGGR